MVLRGDALLVVVLVREPIQGRFGMRLPQLQDELCQLR